MAIAVAARFAELRTGNASDRIALRGVRVRSRLAGLAQRTTVEQTFINLEPRAIEAVYTFPLPEDAAVCGFEIITGDRVLTGAVEESDKAIEKYDDAIADGHAAYMLESDRPDVFTVRVGNLKPKQAATIRISYVCMLARVDKQIRVTFPTTIAPRYATKTGMDPVDAAIDADALNPPHVLSVPYGLTMEVDVALAQRVAQITSPSHRIDVRDAEEGTKRVTLASGVAAMDREVVLTIELAKEHEPRVEIVNGKPGTNESFLAVTFVPEFEETDLVERAHQPGETVFVLDCSGSMQGDSIEQATAALSLCLRSLSPGDTFNVCRFGSTFELLSSEPLVYAQHTLDRAIRYVNASRDLGGTELFAPLESILVAKPRSGGVRQVILLTDGQVTNEPAVVALARKHRAHNRIFTFGIGPACSQFLVKGLARATGGAAEFIAPGERIEEKVLRTFARLTSPMIEEVQIDWDGAEVQTLAEIPPVFDGDVLTVFGRALGTPPKTVTLRCKAGGTDRAWSVPVGHAHDDVERVIPTMWARRTIQSIEEVNDIRGEAHVPGPELSRERALLVQISKDFNLLCSQTSFIAVEHRSAQERNEGRPALRRVPVMLAAGWGGLSEVARMPVACAPSAHRAALYRSDTSARTCDRLLDRSLDLAGLVEEPKLKSKSAGGGFLRSLLRGRASRDAAATASSGEPSASPSEAKLTFDIMHSISADGSAQWSERLEDVIRLSFPSWTMFRTAAADLAVGAGIEPDNARHRIVVDTLVVVLLLRATCAPDEALWRRSHEKAVRWLASVLGKEKSEVEAWLTAQRSRLIIPAVSGSTAR